MRQIGNHLEIETGCNKKTSTHFCLKKEDLDKSKSAVGFTKVDQSRVEETSSTSFNLHDNKTCTNLEKGKGCYKKTSTHFSLKREDLHKTKSFALVLLEQIRVKEMSSTFQLHMDNKTYTNLET